MVTEQRRKSNDSLLPKEGDGARTGRWSAVIDTLRRFLIEDDEGL